MFPFRCLRPVCPGHLKWRNRSYSGKYALKPSNWDGNANGRCGSPPNLPEIHASGLPPSQGHHG